MIDKIRYDPILRYANQEEYPSADTRLEKRKYLNIPYANLSQFQKLDTYLPAEGRDPFPILMSVHCAAFSRT